MGVISDAARIAPTGSRRECSSGERRGPAIGIGSSPCVIACAHLQRGGDETLQVVVEHLVHSARRKDQCQAMTNTAPTHSSSGWKRVQLSVRLHFGDNRHSRLLSF